MNNIQANRYTFTLAMLEPVKLPEYIGSTLRGGFGHAFKKVVCTFKGRQCDDCLLKHRCVYAYVFETLPPEDTAVMRKYRRAPHPFVIEPSMEGRQCYAPGEPLEFGLVLIGKGIEYLPYFIYAFEELGNMGIGKGKGKYSLKQVRCGTEVVYDGAARTMKSAGVATTAETPPEQAADSLTLRFITPTRIVRNEKLVDTPTFQDIFRTLLRRLSLLSYFHCGQELQADYKGLIERSGNIKSIASSLKWHDWERYSTRQDERMTLGGFLGEMTFEGDLAEFIPFFIAGEMVHVGKGTGFGLGGYEILDIDNSRNIL